MSDAVSAKPIESVKVSGVTERAAGDSRFSTLGDRASAHWATIERWLEWLGDWLNPILVKESRQALKSFQFTVTFVLVLVACWIVTIGGVAMIGPGIYYSASGGSLLIAYYAVLALALFVVVPYSSFRSLAAEREDNTYDLLSITTLKPRQVISGKLGSSIVQMAVYFSAVTPCLAFTYLLRGVDLPTIAVLLVCTFFVSLGLSMLGLLLATLSQQKFSQVFISVAFVAGLLWVFILSIAMANEFASFGYTVIGDDEFWVGVTVFASMYATTFALAYFAATGMITFTSENRSTPLRICMLIQQAAFIGWVAVGWLESDYELYVILAAMTLASFYWYIMGALVTSERPEMSERVKRRLPSSFLGRMFLTWLNPGPGCGYMFVVANGTALVLFALLTIVGNNAWSRNTLGWPTSQEMMYLLTIGWGYVVAYVGLGWMVIRALRRIAVVTMLAAALIHFLLVLAGSGIPTTIQLMSVQGRQDAYTYLQVTNPFWSLLHVANGGATTEGAVLVLIVPAAALCVLLLNLPSVIRELTRMRVALPMRVVEDEAELHPAPIPGPTNPWESPDP